jgi:hypothetical protein
LLFSDFQWLVNKRFGLKAPEDPNNAQLVSIASKYFDDEQIQLLNEIRASMAVSWLQKGMQNHPAFLKALAEFGPEMRIQQRFVEANADDDTLDVSPENSRGYLLVMETNRGFELHLKGPLCNPKFSRAEYEKSRATKVKHYRDFISNPFPLWQRFMDGIRKRRAENQKHFPAYFDPMLPAPEVEFADLHPDLHPRKEIPRLASGAPDLT